MDDMDLLIDKADVQAADAAMVRLGYRAGCESIAQNIRNNYDIPYFHEGSSLKAVEIHWDLGLPPCEASGSLLDDVWAEAVQEEIAGAETQVPAAEHLLMH